MKKRRCFYLELNRLYKKSVQATSLSPARSLFLFNRAMIYNSFLQSRSESCAWQWSGKVIVLVVILIQEIHLLHTEEWQTTREERSKIGYTSRESRTVILILEIPSLIECQWSTILHFINLAVDVHLVALSETLEERVELTSHAALDISIKPDAQSCILLRLMQSSSLE